MKSNQFSRAIGPGLAFLAISLSLAVCAQAQTITDLGYFNGLNGWEPYASVIQATDGNFYGTTSGGPGFKPNVFRVTPTGELSEIYRFCSQPLCTDGSGSAALILGSDGNFYSTTYGGGSRAGDKYGAGTVYKMTTAGELTTLYEFCTTVPCTDGEYPLGITLASDRNFYGATGAGGKFKQGTLFRVSPTGEFKLLHTFCSQANCADGSYLFYPPIQGTDGNFYGTTFNGGTFNGGVIYELTSSGTYTVLYNFCSSDQCPNGQYPNSITQGADGNFYGTTQYGGALQGGVIFELAATSHQYTVLHSFPQSIYGFPQTPLTLASDGNLYGTLGGGGSGSWDPLRPSEKSFSSLQRACSRNLPSSMPAGRMASIRLTRFFKVRTAISTEPPPAAVWAPTTAAVALALARSSNSRTASARWWKPCPWQPKPEQA